MPTGQTFTDREFRSEEVVLDGASFVRCRFADCRLIYRGGEPPSMKDCAVAGSSYRFEGCADNTRKGKNILDAPAQVGSEFNPGVRPSRFFPRDNPPRLLTGRLAEPIPHPGEAPIFGGLR